MIARQNAVVVGKRQRNPLTCSIITTPNSKMYRNYNKIKHKSSYRRARCVLS